MCKGKLCNEGKNCNATLGDEGLILYDLDPSIKCLTGDAPFSSPLPPFYSAQRIVTVVR